MDEEKDWFEKEQQRDKLGSLHYTEREAVALCYAIDDAVIRLEIFGEKGRLAISVLQKMVEDIADGGLDDRDVYRSNLLEGLIKHLQEVHGL